MNSSHALLFVFLSGFFVGLRALTPPTVMAWAARAGWLKLRFPLGWVGTLPAAIIFTTLAAVELVNDKRPTTPSRTEAPGLIARIVMGAFTGACISMAGNVHIFFGAIIGVIGALAGTYGGYHARATLDKSLHAPDFVVAIIEDLVAIGGSVLVVSRF